MKTPRRPRRSEGAPELDLFVSVEDVMHATRQPRSSAYRIMDLVAARAGLDLTAREQRAKLLPLEAWKAHAAAVLSPTADEHAPPRRVSTPPRAAPRAAPRVTVESAPAVPLTKPRAARAVAA